MRAQRLRIGFLAGFLIMLAALVLTSGVGAFSNDSRVDADLPAAYFHPNVLYFKVGVESTQSTTLTNNSTEGLKITSIVVSGPKVQNCAFTNSCPLSPSTLGAGKSCTVTLTCEPSTAGYFGQLTDYDNSAIGHHSAKLEATN